jgi:hypothetical protein
MKQHQSKWKKTLLGEKHNSEIINLGVVAEINHFAK